MCSLIIPKSHIISRVLFATGISILSALVAAYYTIPFATDIAIRVGAIIGVMAAPIVVFCLRRKPRVATELPIGVATLFIAFLSARLMVPPFAWVVPPCFFLTSCVLCMCLCPNYHVETARDSCLKCGYCLRGNISGRCPECGCVLSRAENIAVDLGRHVQPEYREYLSWFGILFLVAITVATGIVIKYRLPDTQQELVRLLGHSEMLLRDRAVAKLERQGGQWIVSALGSTNTTVRRAAIGAIEKRRRRGDSDLVLPLLCDSDSVVARSALRILRRDGMPIRGGRLIELLDCISTKDVYDQVVELLYWGK